MIQTRIKLQNFLFEESPTRLELVEYKPQSTKKFKIGVYRNHSFEMVANSMKAYLDYANISADFIYSDYDDSLSFINIDSSVDMMIVWLDLKRYKTNDVESFLNERIDVLIDMFKKPVLVVPFDGNLKLKNNKVVSVELNEIKDKLGTNYYDSRMEQFSGTRLSARACVQVACILGLKYIPAVLNPALKVIALDLDNTLYSGVLGEDGPNGIVLTDGHKSLQETLKNLTRQGFILCAASKNNEDDVKNMFNLRHDFPLRIDDFTKICSSWNNKSDMISEIAKSINISSDAILFIDDNIGEILEVCEVHTGIKIILAKDDANITNNVLKNFSGLLKLNVQREDALRSVDLMANELRDDMKKNLSREEFLKSLNTKLIFTLNDLSQAGRVSELAGKTNQFIFSYKRYSLAEVEDHMKNNLVVTISLNDNLSDSGIIGALCFKCDGKSTVMDECFVSCRALGRGIDEIIVLKSVSIACQWFEHNRLRIEFKKGERNIPAESFMNTYFKDYIKSQNEFVYDIVDNFVDIEIKGEKNER